MKTATARKDISPIVKKGTVLVRSGDYGIIKGHTERKRIEVKVGEDTFHPPNFYPWEEIEQLKTYWKIETTKS